MKRAGRGNLRIPFVSFFLCLSVCLIMFTGAKSVRAAGAGSTDTSVTITYYEYKSTQNPSLVSRTLTVDENTYYSIVGNTVKEYYTDNGVKYVFTGNWDVEGNEYPSGGQFQIVSNVSIRPVYVPVYIVTYMNADRKTVFKTFEVAPGEYHRIITEYPQKEADNKYSYEFAGWTFNDSVVKGYHVIDFSKFYYPSYNKVPRKSVVRFLDANGGIYFEAEVETGTGLTVPATPPVKESTASRSYEFEGWAVNGESIDVTGLTVSTDMTFEPVFSEHETTHRITNAPTPRPTDPVSRENENAGENDEADDADDVLGYDEVTPVPTASTTQLPTGNSDKEHTGTQESSEAADVPQITEMPDSFDDATTKTDATVGTADVIRNEDDLPAGTDFSETGTPNEGTPIGAIAAAGAVTLVLIAGAALIIAKTNRQQ